MAGSFLSRIFRRFHHDQSSELSHSSASSVLLHSSVLNCQFCKLLDDADNSENSRGIPRVPFCIRVLCPSCYKCPLVEPCELLRYISHVEFVEKNCDFSFIKGRTWADIIGISYPGARRLLWPDDVEIVLDYRPFLCVCQVRCRRIDRWVVYTLSDGIAPEKKITVSKICWLHITKIVVTILSTMRQAKLHLFSIIIGRIGLLVHVIYPSVVLHSKQHRTTE